MIKAPFTPEQVERLNWYQTKSGWHPFTCGTIGCQETVNIEGHPPFKVSTTLIATEQGWKCPKCDYTQDWAHSFMVAHNFPTPNELIKNE